MKNKGCFLIAIAGVLWGTIGIFVDGLIQKGLTPEQVAFTRLFLGFIILSLYSLFTIPEALKINKSSLLYSILIGFICQAAFNFFYFNAINKIGVSVSAVLLYTSPLFVALFSSIVYKERIDKRKKISLCVCFIGAIVAVTGGVFDFSSLNLLGIFLGIGSSITYALMPIISKGALNNCKSLTLIIYGFLFGALFMTPLAKPWNMTHYLGNTSTILLMLGLGLIPASLAYIFYLSGIETGIDLSIVGIISSVELVISAILGWTIVGEDFSIVKFLGLCFMIASAIMVKSSENENLDINTATETT
ncbi:DMT family transporter [Clostridium hydrogeniformans]|uniref:DMT family transporter n=1 Tax=Clostridium hydrogeniformans TaxID=349933 RepID=UPI000480F8C0|nr:DMT family transporter [Clostridium hydrogeniformans]